MVVVLGICLVCENSLRRVKLLSSTFRLQLLSGYRAFEHKKLGLTFYLTLRTYLVSLPGTRGHIAMTTPVNVLMVGTGEYTTGYVNGAPSDSDKSAGRDVLSITVIGDVFTIPTQCYQQE